MDQALRPHIRGFEHILRQDGREQAAEEGVADLVEASFTEGARRVKVSEYQSSRSG